MPKMHIFLHIAKTGGTTFSFPLRRLYGFRNTLHIGNQDHDGLRPTAYCELPQSQQDRVQLIKGHVYYGVHSYCPGSSTYFTLLRNPVGRVASFHRMLQNEWPRTDVGQMSLREYLEEDHYTRNEQVRRVAGLPPDEGPCTEETLSKALENVERDFAVLGLTERFDESLILMKRRLGWPGYPYYVTSRVGRKKREGNTKEEKEMEPSVAERIRQQNALDVQLYRRAEERFETNVRNEGEAFQEEVEKFRSRNRWFAPLAALPLRLYRNGRRLVYKISQR